MRQLSRRGSGGTFRLLTVALLAGCGQDAAGAQSPDPFSKQSLDLSSGITVKYVEAGDPAGEVVILLHGITDMSSAMPSLDDCRRAPEQCFRPADFAADVLAFMEAKDIPQTHKTGYFWKQYGKEPLPASGLQEDDIGHNVQWGASEAVAIDLAAYLREDGEPTKDLFYADPNNIRQILTAPGEALLIERSAQNCSP